MTYDTEIRNAAKTLKGSNFVFMHCISIYPTPIEEMNLSRMAWLRKFTSRVGFSDHSIDREGSMVAIAMGACYIEKHFTLDRSLPGPDQKISSLPEDFTKLAEWRDLVHSAMGMPGRRMTDAEKGLRGIYIGKWGDNK